MSRRLLTAFLCSMPVFTVAIVATARTAIDHDQPVEKDAAAAIGHSVAIPAAPSDGSSASADALRGRLAELDGLPDVVTIDRLARVYGPVAFAHRLHAGMSQLRGGCANCHHDPDPEAGVAGCHTCHAASVSAGTLAKPTLKGAFHRQCLSCHRDWAHANACGFCHEEQLGRSEDAPAEGSPNATGGLHRDVVIAPLWVYETQYADAPSVSFHHAGHASSFGVSCNDCHAGESCSHCHDRAAGPRAVDRHADCMTCHIEKNNCAFCHDGRERTVPHHELKTAWSLKPFHNGISCRACHGPPSEFVTPSPNCLDCHGDFDPSEFDHAVTGVPLFGSHAHFPCERCHTSARPGSSVSCSGCHPSDISYPAHMPGKRTVSSSRRGVTSKY
jgi:hypothetical protein